MSTPAISITDVRKDFGDETVLDGVDVTVEQGELLAVMGPNGVGKSVLFSCIAGAAQPSSGQIMIFDEQARSRSDRTSFLLQDALCVDRLTARENIRFYRQLHPQFTDDWRSYVDRLGLEDDLDKRVSDYSGGMVRKLELTIALSIDTPLYLLDEPTAALDLPTIQTVHTLLREKQDDGKTVVLSSHRPMDADIADRLAFVADGRVVTTGSPRSLFDAVPPVLETSVTNADSLAAIALDEMVFPGDGGVRAFEDPARPLEGETDTIRRLEQPTYTDLFNYYTTHHERREGTDD